LCSRDSDGSSCREHTAAWSPSDRQAPRATIGAASSTTLICVSVIAIRSRLASPGSAAKPKLARLSPL
jgi:hypothetical protein